MRKKAVRQLPLDFAGTQKLTQNWYVRYRNIHEILEQNPEALDLVHDDRTRGQKKLKRRPKSDPVAWEQVTTNRHETNAWHLDTKLEGVDFVDLPRVNYFPDQPER